MGLSRALVITSKTVPTLTPATRLTQSYRRISKGGGSFGPEPSVVHLSRVCNVCGNALKGLRSHTCRACAIAASRATMVEIAKLGRVNTHSAIAETRRGRTQAKQHLALRNWNTDTQPKWLSEAVFRNEIQPLLSRIEVSRIAQAIDVSHPYATSIRRGDKRPHPRHWQRLAKLTGVNRIAEPTRPIS